MLCGEMLTVWARVFAFPGSLALDARVLPCAAYDCVHTFCAFGCVGAMPISEDSVAVSIAKCAKPLVLYAAFPRKKCVEATLRARHASQDVSPDDSRFQGLYR